MSNTIRVLGGLALALALSGCTREYLDPKVASQVTVSKNEPPPGCSLVGYIKGSTTFGDLGDAHGEVLRSAVLRGGNFVSVDLVERPLIIGMGGYAVRGRLFTCGPQGKPAQMASSPISNPAPRNVVPASAVGPAAEVKTCEPECAGGFTCQLGACVSLPPTQAGR